MTAYADASLIVSAFTDERHTVIAQEWFASLASGELVSSAWGVVEVASALSAKVRGGDLRPVTRAKTAEAIRAMLDGSARMLEVGQEHYVFAEELLERSTTPLYAGDALHLAIAHQHGSTLWTIDSRMAQAGKTLGLDAQLVT